MEKTGTCHEDQLKRLRRTEGQIRGIIDMIQKRRYCTDILQQIKAVKSAINAIEVNIVAGHLNHCVKEAINSGSDEIVESAIEEVSGILKRALK